MPELLPSDCRYISPRFIAAVVEATSTLNTETRPALFMTCTVSDDSGGLPGSGVTTGVGDGVGVGTGVGTGVGVAVGAGVGTGVGVGFGVVSE